VKLHLSTRRIVTASVVAAIGLVIVGWLDYGATRTELLQLMREQAVALRQTIAAAARSNAAAGVQAESQVTERLLDNARLLAELDRRHVLDQALLDKIADRNRLFRVVVFGADGAREWASGGSAAISGRGFPGPSAQPLLEQLLSGKESEVVAQLHSPRRGGGGRIAAGIHRAGGGAIMLNADASEIEALLTQVSLDSLLQDIAVSTPQLAYVMLDRGDVHIAHGDVPAAAPPSPSSAAQADGDGSLAEEEVRVLGRPILQFSGSVVLGDGPGAMLRFGLRLDELRRAERRLLIRLAVSLTAALVLSLLTLGTVWLRQSYEVLSEKHALAEAALRRRDRLSAMGELASTVAHEVRNPLNAIAMSAQRLRREFLEAPARTDADAGNHAEMEQLLDVVAGESRRINDIVQQFLDFARPPKIAPHSTDLASEVRDIVEATRPLALSRGITLDADVTGAATAVIDPAQLRQAIDNLLRNAIEATPPGGNVAVVARSTGKGHSIDVRDTGVGIPQDDLPRVFDLYFTTKAHGTGVGLAVTHQIVSAHGGTIEVDSKPGAGTRMTIRLPALPEGVTRA
jgi:signal transduction histidine kinase